MFSIGMYGRYAIRHGYWYHQRSFGASYIYRVRDMNLTTLRHGRKYLSETISKFGLATVDRVNLSANIVSTLQIGCFAGALIAFPFADRWGRRPSLIGMAFIAFLGIVFQFASSSHIAAMYVGRYVYWRVTGRS